MNLDYQIAFNSKSFCHSYCFSDINECSSNPCKNHGKCSNLVNKYKCTCMPGFIGEICDTCKSI